MRAVEKTVFVRFAFGAGMALAGVAFVETALYLGFRPLAPVGIPGVGMFVGTALGGVAGFAGGIGVVTLYGLLNWAYFSSRFPEFYSTTFYLWMWITVFTAIVLTILLARPRHMLGNYVPDLDVGGKVKGFFVMVTDITALAMARDELRKEQARLESALDGSSVALWDTDLLTQRVYLSEAWSAIIGAPRAEMT